MKRVLFFVSILSAGLMLMSSCASFKAERVSAQDSDKKALDITDQWLSKDTEDAVSETMKLLEDNKGLKEFTREKGKKPVVFIGEVQNDTSEAYFPIDDFNDEMLNAFATSGDFTLVDATARENLLKEITYQNDGMVDPKSAKTIGKQTGADAIIYGAIRMRPATRDGKTIKEYSINIHLTDIEKGTEIMRTRTKAFKYSEQSKSGW